MVSFNQTYGIVRPVVYTPTITWTNQTVTTPTGSFLKTPGQVTVWGTFIISGTGAAGICTISLPTGYTVNATGGAIQIAVGVVGSTTVGPYTLGALTAGTTVTSLFTVAPGLGNYGFQIIVPTIT